MRVVVKGVPDVCHAANLKVPVALLTLVSGLAHPMGYEFLALHSGVALGPLQQRYPMVHLLRRVGVAVKHPVGRDDHERVGSERRGEKEAKPLSSTETVTSV